MELYGLCCLRFHHPAVLALALPLILSMTSQIGLQSIIEVLLYLHDLCLLQSWGLMDRACLGELLRLIVLRSGNSPAECNRSYLSSGAKIRFEV